MDTVARFMLLRLNGKRTLTVKDSLGNSHTRSATEWLLDCFFFPEMADTYPCFSVESYETIIAIGLTPQNKKRGRYSYNELKPGLDRLLQLARQASDRPAEARAFIDNHLITLANNVLFYESLKHFLDFARFRIDPSQNGLLQELGISGRSLTVSDVMEHVPPLLRRLIDEGEAMATDRRDMLVRGMNDLFSQLDTLVATSRLFSIFPPENPEESTWLTPGDVLERAFEPTPSHTPPLEIMRAFEGFVEAVPGSPMFIERVAQLCGLLRVKAEQRGDYGKIALEVHYYRGRYLFLSQWLFVASFLLIACSWLQRTPGRFSRWLNLSLAPPIVLLAAAITLRCLIRGRPPVTTLYETILFATLVAVLLGFLIEFLMRNRISMSVGALLGIVGLFFAWRYEAREGTDTMPAVIAVLDTNFWLASHVTTIIIGYGAGLFSSALAHVYLGGRIVGFKRDHPQYYADFGRILYGVTAFCLLFTLIGTVLGGLWAAQSWGRFWGWDPKENGALLIVLWALATLHARRGGYIRPDGIALCAIVLGMIVVFAWWGVNALGIGLHSYGFISGVWRALGIFWLLESTVILVGMFVWRRQKIPAAETV